MLCPVWLAEGSESASRLGPFDCVLRVSQVFESAGHSSWASSQPSVPVDSLVGKADCISCCPESAWWSGLGKNGAGMGYVPKDWGRVLHASPETLRPGS